MYKTEKWIDEDELKNIKYSDYWNNSSEEEKKHWSLIETDPTHFKRLIMECSALRQFRRTVSVLTATNKIQQLSEGIALNLGAGCAWLEPFLFEQLNIRHCFSVEYSKHRLFRLAPQVLESFSIPKDQVTLVLGNFDRLQLKDASTDLAIMCASLHHAVDPLLTLKEIKRCLKPKGIVIILDEPRVKYLSGLLKYWIKSILFLNRSSCKSRFFFPPANHLFPEDQTLGDHYYSYFEYKRFFSAAKFDLIYSDHNEKGLHAFLLQARSV